MLRSSLLLENLHCFVHPYQEVLVHTSHTWLALRPSALAQPRIIPVLKERVNQSKAARASNNSLVRQDSVHDTSLKSWLLLRDNFVFLPATRISTGKKQLLTCYIYMWGHQLNIPVARPMLWGFFFASLGMMRRGEIDQHT
ncbi:uncharacterized protein H6S33_004447 [Morchella sextelata]|uniref:uncharacterized protein n=1 Tax=Morchella sextelata TaxID=1174677 RepID=UPI001D03C9C0|nr:uncharacterized protein H6S33_004447 [Morchella sextelata]KAH0605990.1 hypothetical protein H6S33_004447 [Morchella sextelata]